MIAWSKDYPLPNWTENLLQGSAYWVGYKTQLYRHYPLTEGAIVGESVSLISGSLDSNLKLICEVMYSKLGVKNSKKTRADLVIKNGEEIDTVIEVKRAIASNAKIENDLKRLAECNAANPKTRCFLLLVSQSTRPKQFIDDKNGRAIRKVIKTSGYEAKVRRACKASSSFEKKNKAHYSCLIEVVSKKNIKI